MESNDWEMVDDTVPSDTAPGAAIRRVQSSKSGLAFEEEACSVSRASSDNNLPAAEHAAQGDDALMQEAQQHGDQGAAEAAKGPDTSAVHQAALGNISRPGSAMSFEQLLLPSPSDDSHGQPTDERFEQLLVTPDAANSAAAGSDAMDVAADEHAADELLSQQPDAAAAAGSDAVMVPAAAAHDAGKAINAPDQSTAHAVEGTHADSRAAGAAAAYEHGYAEKHLPQDSFPQPTTASDLGSYQALCYDPAHEPMWLTVSLQVDPACADAPVQLAFGRAVAAAALASGMPKTAQHGKARRSSGGGIGGNLRLLNWLLPSLLCIVTLHHLIRRGGSSGSSGSGSSFIGPLLQPPASPGPGLLYCRASGGGALGSSSGYGCSELVLVGCSSSGLGSSSGNLSSCSS